MPDGPSKVHPLRARGGEHLVSTAILDSTLYADTIRILINLPQVEIVIHQLSDEEREIEIERPAKRPRSVEPRTYISKGNVYDRPPLPSYGEWDERALYEAVGRATSAWETLEYSLSQLFLAIVSPTLHYFPIERAYGSIAAFSGRLDMIKAAKEARLYLNFYDDSDDRLELDAIIKLAEKLSARRNEIAHGIVKRYFVEKYKVSGVLVMPSDYANSKHKFRQDINPRTASAARKIVPVYGYGVPEVSFFEAQFLDLSERTELIISNIMRVLNQ